jgi:hypothetical protein
MRSQNNNMAEFKGKTEATLQMLVDEIRGMRSDIEDLKGWKSWSLGAGAMAGFFAGLLKDIFLKKY